MTQKISIFSLAIVASAAIEAERFVGADGAYATAAGTSVGVSTTKAAAVGERFNADVLGTTIVTAGGVIAKNAYLQVGANGKAVTRTAGVSVAQALQAAAADGDRIEVLLIPNAP
jgi:hypothetical protein